MSQGCFFEKVFMLEVNILYRMDFREGKIQQERYGDFSWNLGSNR